MKRQTRLGGSSIQKYRAACDDCPAESNPVSQRFAEAQAEQHEDNTGHSVTVEPVEQETDRAGSAIQEVYEGP